MGPDGRRVVRPETVEQWRAWLAEHPTTEEAGVWLVLKSSTGRSWVSYEAVVCEALAWGWIDSTAGTVDAERSRLWLSPRSPVAGGRGPTSAASRS